MIVPKTRQAASYFGKLIRERLVNKKYISINYGVPLLEGNIFNDKEIKIGLEKCSNSRT